MRSVTQFDDGKHAQLASSSYDGTIRMWNVLTGACDMTLKAHDKPVKTIIQLDDSRLCSCSYDKTIKIWDMNASKCEMTLKGDQVFCIPSTTFFPSFILLILSLL